jgi:hypothetical protein
MLNLVAIERPAASSDERFTRRPDDRRSNDLDNMSLLTPKLRCAVKLGMLVLTDKDIGNSSLTETVLKH